MVVLCLFKMPYIIKNLTDCECAAIQEVKSVEIHSQISEVYEKNTMPAGMERK